MKIKVDKLGFERNHIQFFIDEIILLSQFESLCYISKIH